MRKKTSVRPRGLRPLGIYPIMIAAEPSLVNKNGGSSESEEGKVARMKLFLLALGLAMILEGIPYFLSPRKAKELAQLLPRLPDAALRFLGLGLMILGLTLLFVSRRWLK